MTGPGTLKLAVVGKDVVYRANQGGKLDAEDNALNIYEH